MAGLRLLSPRGESALAVLRVGGGDPEGFLRSLGVEALPEAGSFRLCELNLRGLREQALCLGVPEAPGEFELHVHGNPLLVDLLLAEGEETPPGKGGGLAERILELAQGARSPLGARWCLAQLDGEGLLPLLRRLVSDPRGLLPDLEACLEAGLWLRPFLEPPRVLLRGRTNAGKSTLMNLCLGRERVRTGPDPALTLDPVEEWLRVGELPVRLVDTAGEGEDTGPLDSEARGRQARLGPASDLCLRLCSTLDPDPRPAPGEIRIWTHADLAPPPDWARGEPAWDLVGGDPAAIRAALFGLLGEALGVGGSDRPYEAAFLDREQEGCLRRLAARLAAGEEGEAAELGRSLLSMDCRRIRGSS